ncbi:hypothetical protein SAMN02745216_04162 [Desulfatibacillum alkenivorans DSM 16219]|jgi:hypothetical protein|uniref:Dolichyl-phosphate-mannose-protein mannosyltransferase n=2 Tax=Desulfatibacillum alkenivorans TaxID=259354 RepID=A0A1M6VQN6_9BACT|nr:hypothetical protein SAMN02745216_04162 [Desulfatibacillum alkenivorans DSM 16219]
MENQLNSVSPNSPQWSRLLTGAAWFLAIANALWAFSLIMADPDLWGHLRFGQALVENGSLHATDPFSLTAFGHIWINHEWLTELVFWVAYANFGDAGLLLGKLLIGLCIVFMLIKTCRDQPIIAAALVVSLAAFAAAPGFNVRPQVFSFFFYTVFIVVLREFFSGGKNLLFLLPISTVIWVQLHGGFLMGVVVLGLAAGWATLMQWVSGKKEFSLKSLWFWTLLTFAAPLVNPYGYKLLLFFSQTLSVPRAISEWEPLPLMDFSHWQAKLLMAMFFAAVCLKPEKIRKWEAVVVFFTIYASLKHVRHLPFFAITVAPWLVDWIGEAVAGFKKKHPETVMTLPTIGVIAAAFFAAGAVQCYKTVDLYKTTNLRIVVDQDFYPVHAVRYMKANNLTGGLILPFDWGEFAMWHLYPNMLVSIDGRFRTCYPEQVIQDHMLAFALPWQEWRRLDKYKGDVLLTPNTKFFQKLAALNKGWKIIHADSTAILFLRDNEHNQPVLARFRGPGFVKPDLTDIQFFP